MSIDQLKHLVQITGQNYRIVYIIPTSRNSIKKYAAIVGHEKLDESISYASSQEVKGLDIVRRDWSCVLSKATGRQILGDFLIFSCESRDEVVDKIHAH